jgi:hypothetical protein
LMALPAVAVCVSVRGSVVPGARWWFDHAMPLTVLTWPVLADAWPGRSVWSADRVARPA